MASPFPGMDPFLERHWLDVHASLVIEARNALNRVLPNELVATTEERIAVESDADDLQIVGPDIRVIEPAASTSAAATQSPAAMLAPIRLVAVVDPIKEKFIKIVEAGTERLITVLEFLSPTNKLGGGLRKYRRKRQKLLAAGVNVVEIDLVRTGNWEALLRPQRCPDHSRTTYRTTIRRADEDEAAYLQPIRLQDRLPVINVPLRPTDSPARLDLQALLDSTYANGRYDRRLNYAGDLQPPISAEESAWASELLKRRGS